MYVKSKFYARISVGDAIFNLQLVHQTTTGQHQSVYQQDPAMGPISLKIRLRDNQREKKNTIP